MKVSKLTIVIYSLCFLVMVVIIVLIYFLTKKPKKEEFINPITGKITSPFGYRTHPITGEYLYHNGVDVAVVTGTDIKAPADGIVDSSYYNDVGGLQVVLKHDNGYKTGYAHLSQALVAVGETVKQGQVIAKSGNTGRSTGPHLHFTFTNQLGVKLDPEETFTFV